jgi:hypothetical protein
MRKQCKFLLPAAFMPRYSEIVSAMDHDADDTESAEVVR